VVGAHLDCHQPRERAAWLQQESQLVGLVEAERQARERHRAQAAPAQAAQHSLERSTRIAARHHRQLLSASGQK
jgi:hypothetical protein